jgi:hypothetical protein
VTMPIRSVRVLEEVAINSIGEDVVNEAQNK